MIRRQRSITITYLPEIPIALANSLSQYSVPKPGKFGGVSENNNTCYKTRQYSLIKISDLELEGNDDSWANF